MSLIVIQLEPVGKLFDESQVARAVRMAQRRHLYRGGGLVRTIARRSMRRRKSGVSAPGQPPFAHTGVLRDGVIFVVNEDLGEVIIGPRRETSKAKAGGSGGSGGKPVTHLLEFGGTVRTKGGKAKRYPPRPYMGPALEKASQRYADLWANSVK